MIWVRRYGETGLHKAESSVVGLKKIAASGKGRVRVALEVGTELLKGLEVVFDVLGLAFGVVESDIVAKRPIEID